MHYSVDRVSKFHRSVFLLFILLSFDQPVIHPSWPDDPNYPISSLKSSCYAKVPIPPKVPLSCSPTSMPVSPSLRPLPPPLVQEEWTSWLYPYAFLSTYFLSLGYLLFFSVTIQSSSILSCFLDQWWSNNLKRWSNYYEATTSRSSSCKDPRRHRKGAGCRSGWRNNQRSLTLCWAFETM